MLDRNKIEQELIKAGANPSLNGFKLIPDILNAIDKEIQNGNIKITCIIMTQEKLTIAQEQVWKEI